MRTAIFIPPLARVSGGLAVLRQVALNLAALGRQVVLCPFKENAPGSDFYPPELEVIPWSSLKLGPKDVWLVPEGWPNALAPGLLGKASCYVYVQNWAFMFSPPDPSSFWRKLPLRFIAVSGPVAWFVENILHLKCSGILRPALDPELFQPRPKISAKTIDIAWMPRKNKGLAEQIFHIFTARTAGSGLPPCRFIEINRLAQAEVAERLGASQIFLITGFPEGCPLPPLEALASGCLAVGFTGLGGWDYMRQIAPTDYQPALPLPPLPWGGNGFFCPDGDVLAAALALEKAVKLIASPTPALDNALTQARLAASFYSHDNQLKALQEIFD